MPFTNKLFRILQLLVTYPNHHHLLSRDKDRAQPLHMLLRATLLAVPQIEFCRQIRMHPKGVQSEFRPPLALPRRDGPGTTRTRSSARIARGRERARKGMPRLCVGKGRAQRL